MLILIIIFIIELYREKGKNHTKVTKNKNIIVKQS